MEVVIENVSKSFRNGRKTLPVLEDINITLKKRICGPRRSFGLREVHASQYLCRPSFTG